MTGPPLRGGLPTGTGGEYWLPAVCWQQDWPGPGGVRQPDGAAQAYSMDSAGMQSAQSGAAHQGSSEAMEEDEKQLSPLCGR